MERRKGKSEGKYRRLMKDIWKQVYVEEVDGE